MIVGLDPVFVVWFGFLSLGLFYAIILLARWLKRRAALRRFAAGHHFRFRGVLPSDKYAPYTAFRRVQSSVLLYMVMEGRRNDFDVALFDYNRRRVSHTSASSCRSRTMAPVLRSPCGLSRRPEAGASRWKILASLHGSSSPNLFPARRRPRSVRRPLHC